MSYCKSEGKDKIIFATKEDHTIPSKVPFPEEDEDDRPAGLVLPNGDINWGCPCLGGMATGPCGVDFREAFSCFHYSKADPKGSDCLENFRKMTECMSQYPGVYGSREGDDEEEEEKLFKPLEEGNASESENKETDSRTSQISKSSSAAS